ncbi:hypothetical protein HZH66_014628 [Vespula vulgaris]|uniref:Uncharacterized protein n=1 Tax=Vespula vulgaris TaxID=7454 RepID=A0A834J1Q6_VESVU|nr:hypothetical protein HZH66_014628 [Vespula vulgaris]
MESFDGVKGKNVFARHSTPGHSTRQRDASLDFASKKLRNFRCVLSCACKRDGAWWDAAPTDRLPDHPEDSPLGKEFQWTIKDSKVRSLSIHLDKLADNLFPTNFVIMT